MRLPWSTSKNNNASVASDRTSKSESALSGAAGDGKVHDLQYWLDSGFLTLPRPDPDWPAPAERSAPKPS
jgi:hypothetical protein